MEPHERFLEMAVELAERSVAEGGGPFGAVVVRAGEVIGRGANGVTRDCDPTAHAEIRAIRAACQVLGTFDISGCTLYVSCEPCTMCLSAAYWAHLDAIYFAADREAAAAVGFDDLFIAQELALPAEQRHLAMYHLELPAGGRPFVEWAAKPDKVEY